MRSVQSNKLDFKGQNIYVGIDVHLKITGNIDYEEENFDITTNGSVCVFPL
jgi:hypothetical protein